MTLSCMLKALYAMNNQELWMILMTRGYGWHEQLRVMSLVLWMLEKLQVVVDINDFKSSTQDCRCYEHLRVEVDINNLWLT